MRYVLGQKTFTKPDTAAQHAVDTGRNPNDYRILEHGKTRELTTNEVEEFLLHMSEWVTL